MSMTAKLLRALAVLALFLPAGSGWAAAKPPTNTPPTVSLTSPANGATFTAPATITLTATAADANGTVSKVEFYRGTTLIGTSTAAPYGVAWSNVAAGSYSLTAKATDNGGAVTTSAAVSITVASGSGGGGNITVSSPPNGATVYTDTVTISGTYVGGTATVLVDNGGGSKLATVSGTSFIASVPLYLGTNTLTVSVARTDKTSDKAMLTVKRNSAPLAVFTSPVTTSYNAPANITLGVDAVSPAGSIASVTLTRNGSPLATLTVPPYQYAWNNVASGSYTIGATATDNTGQTGSASVVFAVGGPNLLPSVSLISPTPSVAFSTPANITMTAAANDSDGTIAQVEFLQNGNLLGVSNVVPYTFVWSNAPEGNYDLAARATDNAGGVATSPVVPVTVRTPPPVAITSPANGATFTTPAAVRLTAEAPSNTLGVSFYRRMNGVDTLIGDSPSTASPYTYDWSVRTAGTYTVVSRAIVQVQGFPQPFEFWSDPVTITVNANPAGEITYLHHDFAGSVIGATDTNGAVIWKEEYQPYGERIRNEAAATGNRQFYTGKAFDPETGLSYMGARYYDVAMGRFMGEDAVGFAPENIHSFNRYAYARNNPYRFIDPDGHDAVDWVRGGLTIASFCPSACGSVFSAIDGVVALATGDNVGAGISFGAAAIGVIGDAGAVKVVGMAAREAAVIKGEKTFQTYTKTNPATAEVYCGRTGGCGTALENIASRDASHHMTDKGFGPAVLDKSSTNAAAIRGREQMMIEANGGAKSVGGTSGNAINGISSKNPKRDTYIREAKKEFGE